MLNGVVTLAIVLAGLALHAARLDSAARSRSSERARRCGARLGAFAVGAALPLALQLLYVVCLPFAARLGGRRGHELRLRVSGGLVARDRHRGIARDRDLGPALSSGPGSGAGRAATSLRRHGCAGARREPPAARSRLRAEISSRPCSVRRTRGTSAPTSAALVAVLSPWMIAAVGVAVTFPLAFVAGRTRGLPWIALGALALQVPLAWAGAEVLELDGLALALAVSTLLVLAALLVELNALGGTIRRLGAAAAFVAA